MPANTKGRQPSSKVGGVRKGTKKAAAKTVSAKKARTSSIAGLETTLQDLGVTTADEQALEDAKKPHPKPHQKQVPKARRASLRIKNSNSQMRANHNIKQPSKRGGNHGGPRGGN